MFKLYWQYWLIGLLALVSVLRSHGKRHDYYQLESPRKKICVDFGLEQGLMADATRCMVYPDADATDYEIPQGAVRVVIHVLPLEEAYP